jgi:hypothetical protein
MNAVTFALERMALYILICLSVLIVLGMIL